MTPESSPATVDLLRHGEVGDGVLRFRGRCDDPLTERGWTQVRSVLGAEPPWSAVLTSPRQRCAALARHLASNHGLQFRVLEDLAELDFGEWEGRSIDDVQTRDAASLQRFWRDPDTHPPPGGERFSAFSERVLEAWQNLVSSHRGRHVLVIAHGGTIRVILAHVLGMPSDRLLSLDVPYAGLSRVKVGADFAQLTFLNRRSAL